MIKINFLQTILFDSSIYFLDMVNNQAYMIDGQKVQEELNCKIFENFSVHNSSSLMDISDEMIEDIAARTNEHKQSIFRQEFFNGRS